jgi:hypothetical protein
MAAIRSLSVSSLIVLVPFDHSRNNNDAEDASEEQQPPERAIHMYPSASVVPIPRIDVEPYGKQHEGSDANR